MHIVKQKRQVSQGGVLQMRSVESPGGHLGWTFFKHRVCRLVFLKSSLVVNDQRCFISLITFSDFVHYILIRSLIEIRENDDFSITCIGKGDHFLAYISVCNHNVSQPSYFTLVFSVSTLNRPHYYKGYSKVSTVILLSALLFQTSNDFSQT